MLLTDKNVFIRPPENMMGGPKKEKDQTNSSTNLDTISKITRRVCI